MSGLPIPAPGFSGDDGSAAPGLLAALATGDADTAQAALLGARVLAPLVAVLEERDGDREKSSAMAVVTVQRADGARALPVFTSTAALEAWNADARPTPVLGPLAARAALSEGCDALVVDPGQPHRSVVQGPWLLALAEGRPRLPAAEDPEIARVVGEAVRAAAAALGLAAADLQAEVRPDNDADAVVVITVDAEVDRVKAAQAAQSLAERLAADPVVRARVVRGIDVRLLG